jgi:hypothetical protein
MKNAILIALLLAPLAALHAVIPNRNPQPGSDR